MTTKATNPKDRVGSGKLPLHLWPASATMLGCLGLLDGMLKYGRANWREAGVRASIYVDAAQRHLNAWFEGEDRDPDSGLPHLAHALACLAILIDADASDTLTDDRQYRGHGYREMVNWLTPEVERLKALHADKAPQHYDIRFEHDSPYQEEGDRFAGLARLVERPTVFEAYPVLSLDTAVSEISEEAAHEALTQRALRMRGHKTSFDTGRDTA